MHIKPRCWRPQGVVAHSAVGECALPVGISWHKSDMRIGGFIPSAHVLTSAELGPASLHSNAARARFQCLLHQMLRTRPARVMLRSWPGCHVATPVQAMDITFGTTGMTEEDPTESSEQDLEGGLTSKEGPFFTFFFGFLL